MLLGDGEANTFAEQIKAALVTAGWDVDGVSHSVYTGGAGPIGLLIRVNYPTPPPPAALLQIGFKAIGFEAAGFVDAEVSGVSLTVGRKP